MKVKNTILLPTRMLMAKVTTHKAKAIVAPSCPFISAIDAIASMESPITTIRDSRILSG